MKKFFSKFKYKKIVFSLSIVVAILTLNIFTYPAFTEEVVCQGDSCLTNVAKLNESSLLNNKSVTNSVVKMAKNNNLVPIKTKSTKEYIEMNLYDYGTKINNNHLNKGVYNSVYYTYPGFTQSRGQQALDFSLFNDYQIAAAASTILNSTAMYYLGDTVVKDVNAPLPVLATSGIYNFTLNSQYDSTIFYPLTNQMNSTLVNGYPAFNVNGLGTWTGSLDYLFSNNSGSSVTKYGNLDGLFQYNEDTGLYYYSSRDNHAELDGSEFKVYSQIMTPDYMKYPFGNFLPFNSINTQATQVSSITRQTLQAMKNNAASKSGSQYKKLSYDLNAYDIAMASYKGSNYSSWDSIELALNALNQNGALSLSSTAKTEIKNSLPNLYAVDYDEETNFFFGFDMKFNFMQPKDGLIGKNHDQKMIFRFEGDDDVWVYIDDTLFLDLSGIHAQIGGEIDFHDGVVRYYAFDKSNFSANKTSAYREVGFEEIFVNNMDKLEKFDNGTPYNSLDDFYRLKEDAIYSLNFYYMERGASSGVMTTMFNLPLVDEHAIKISKEVSSESTGLGNPTYQFQVMKNGSDSELFVGSGVGYDVYSSANENKIRSDVTDDYGFIKLHGGEYAVIDGIKENAGKYYIRELIEKGAASQFDDVTIDGKDKEFSSSTVKYGSKEYVYASSVTKDMKDVTRTTKFINNINNNLGELTIKKSLAKGTDSSANDTEFQFKVEIAGVPLAVNSKYMVGDNEKHVLKSGIIVLKPNEVAKITNIYKNSSFKVEEILDSTSGFSDRYVVDGDAVNTDYASGVIVSKSSVEVINAEATGTYVNIPVKKKTTNPDGVLYTYTFTLKDVDTNEVFPSKTITVDKDGNGYNEALFTINYSRLQNQNEENIHNYLLYEEKKTILGEDEVSNDKYTLYDDTVYALKVKVTNNSSGFNAEISSIKVGDKSKSEIVFNNKRLSSLTINKIVENSPNDKSKFNFNIESTGLADGLYKSSTGDDVVFKNNKATVKLSHNESITIYGLPYGSKYNITETNNDGYAVMYRVDSNGYKEGDDVTNITLLKKTDNSKTFGINYDTSVTFKNVRGYELPKTGSRGMLLLTSIGMILMGISSVYALNIKKKDGEI